MVTLSKQIEKLSSAINKKANANEGNVAILGNQNLSGAKRALNRPSSSKGVAGVFCSFYKNNNHSTNNCNFRKEKLARLNYYNNNAHMALVEKSESQDELINMMDDHGIEIKNLKDQSDVSESDQILGEFNKYNNMLENNNFRRWPKDKLLSMANEMVFSYPDICKLPDEAFMVEENSDNFHQNPIMKMNPLVWGPVKRTTDIEWPNPPAEFKRRVVGTDPYQIFGNSMLEEFFADFDGLIFYQDDLSTGFCKSMMWRWRKYNRARNFDIRLEPERNVFMNMVKLGYPYGCNLTAYVLIIGIGHIHRLTLKYLEAFHPCPAEMDILLLTPPCILLNRYVLLSENIFAKI